MLLSILMFEKGRKQIWATGVSTQRGRFQDENRAQVNETARRPEPGRFVRDGCLGQGSRLTHDVPNKRPSPQVPVAEMSEAP